MTRGRRGRPPPAPVHVEPTGPVLYLRGEGLKDFLSPEEGRRRLDALVTLVPIEEWAGSVADAVALEREHGVAQADLLDWEARGLIVSLDDKDRGRVYPVEQFIDGQPVVGVAEVLAMIAKPRVAWHWLARPHTSMNDARAIDLLRSGRVRRVLLMARLEWVEQA